MKPVKVRDGYEGAYVYDDGARGYTAYARPEGRTWWTKCAYVGHAHEDAEELERKAIENIEKWIGYGMVR